MGAGYAPVGYCPHCGYRVDPGRCPECGRDVVNPAKRDPRLRRRVRRWLIGLSAFALVLTGLWFGRRYIFYNWWPATHLRRLSYGSEPWRSRAYDVILYRYHKYKPRVVARVDRIKAELEQLPDHDWAGYYRGATRVSPVYLAPENGVAYYGGGLGPVRINYGEVVDVSPDALTLKLRFDPAGMGRNVVTERMVRVWWGDCHFLIPEHRMIKFCNAVNTGEDKPLSLSRDGCGASRPSGQPTVPAEYERFIFKEPLLTTVTVVDDLRKARRWGRQWTVATARIDAGTDNGVFPDMELLLVGDQVKPWEYWNINVIEVQQGTATIAAWHDEKHLREVVTPFVELELGSLLRAGGFDGPLTPYDTVPDPRADSGHADP